MFRTNIGLGQHMRHSHPVQLNEERLKKIEKATSRWRATDTNQLEKVAWPLVEEGLDVPTIVERVSSLFPGKKTSQLVTRVEMMKAKKLGEVRLDDIGSQEESNRSDGEIVNDWRTGLLRAALEQLSDCVDDPLSLKTLSLMVSMMLAEECDDDQARQALDDHANLVFEYRWKPSKRGGRPPPPPNASKKFMRRTQYGFVQRLYAMQRKDAVDTVLSGAWETVHLADRGLPPQAGTYWSELLSKPHKSDGRAVRKVLPVNWKLMEPVRPDEVFKALQTMRGTAAGPDRLSVDDALRANVSLLAGYYNLLMATAHLPKALRCSRVTLVPKVQGKVEDPSDLRPISVSSVIMRCLHKVIANRWLNSLKLQSIQFAFLRCDGTFEATNLMDTLLRNSRITHSGLAMGSIDVSKAFDSVSHDTILRSAESFGAPKPLVEFIRSSYDGATAQLGDHTIRIQRGVRQGDPLSPLLFIMAMDEVINLANPKIGIDFHGQVVDAIAFADDLVVLASDKVDLQTKLKLVANALDRAGMSLNMRKSFTLVIKSSKKLKVTAVDTEPIVLGGSELRALGPSETFRYLGINLNWRGRDVFPHRALLHDWLINITRAPLKPQQRMIMLREYVIPKLIHSLVLGVAHRNTLKALDRLVHQAIRNWLRLPKDTNVPFFHAAYKDGGLGIPSLSSSIPLLKRARLEKMMASENPIIRRMVMSAAFAGSIVQNSRPGLVKGHEVQTLQEARNLWANLLRSSRDGGYLCETVGRESLRWLVKPEKTFPRLYIRGVQLRANTLGTKVRASRGRPVPAERLKCRGLCGLAESLTHVVQGCAVTHEARCVRHNRVVRILVKCLRKKGYDVTEEPRIPLVQSFCKPDILVVHEETAYIIDVAIPSEQRMATTWKEKVEKYSVNDAAIRRYLENVGKPVRLILHVPVVIGMRGIWFSRSSAMISRLGITKLNKSDMAVTAMMGTLKCYDTYMRGTSAC